MTARKLVSWFAGCLLAAVMADRARAQQEFAAPEIGGDAQLFAPIDFSFEGLPIRDSAGWYFSFDKLSWAATGERLKLGQSFGDDASMNPYRVFDSGGQIVDPDPTDDEDDLVFLPGIIVQLPPPVLLGSINDSGPRAEFGWGERYELGRFNGENGWFASILDGPSIEFNRTYGWGLTGQDDTVTGGLGLPSRFPNAPNQLLSPLGSVLIVFSDPQNLMLGYLDVVHGAFIGTTPGGALEADTNGDGVLDGDGLADDIDRDGHFGPDGLDTEDPGEIPDVLGGGLPHDLDDLVRLPTSWQFVNVRNSTETQGIEIMRQHRLNNKHFMAKYQNNTVDVSYGVRYLRLRDEFIVDAEGGVMGRSFWDTRITNNLVGPQIGLRWLHQRHRLSFDWNGRFLFGANIGNFEQTAALGEDLITGQHNHPLYFPPTYSVHGKQENRFSPTAEMRVQASYQLTSAIALKLGYTAIFVDNISRAANQVKYELPQMGFREDTVGQQEIFINGANVGVEVIY